MDTAVTRTLHITTTPPDTKWIENVSSKEVPSPRETDVVDPLPYVCPEDFTTFSSDISLTSISSENIATPALPESFTDKTTKLAIIHSAKNLEKKNIFNFDVIMS